MQGLNYIRCGNYYIPDIPLPEENRPIGRWGRMHRNYLKAHNPIRFDTLCLDGALLTSHQFVGKLVCRITIDKTDKLS